MSLKHLFNRLTIATVVAGATCAFTTPVFAQFFAQQSGFYFPSASFFSPFAAPFESEEEPDLAMLLEQYPAFNTRLQQSNLLETLENQEYLTVLVPSEEAFDTLPSEMKQRLAEPENMEKLMQYHLVEGQISESDFEDGAVETVLEQNSVKITSVPMGDDQISVKLNEANASEPLAASDGMVIPIDQVLIPPEFSTSARN